jgi:NTE family protein
MGRDRQLGTTQGIATEFYQPVDYRQVFFVRPYASATSRIANLYSTASGSPSTASGIPLGVDAGVNLGIYGQAKWAGSRRNRARTWRRARRPSPTSRAAWGHHHHARDRPEQLRLLPDEGLQGRHRLLRCAARRVGAQVLARGGHRDGRHPDHRAAVVPADVRGWHAAQGRASPDGLFQLGGLGRLSAFAPGQILADEYVFGSARLEYRLVRPVPVLGLSVLAGLNYERAHVKNPITEPNLRGNIDSYGAYLGATTPVGRSTSVVGTQDRRGRVFFFLGTP